MFGFKKKNSSLPVENNGDIKNAFMITPLKSDPKKMYVWRWQYCDHLDGKKSWGWEPLFALDSDNGTDLFKLIEKLE